MENSYKNSWSLWLPRKSIETLVLLEIELLEIALEETPLLYYEKFGFQNKGYLSGVFL